MRIEKKRVDKILLKFEKVEEVEKRENMIQTNYPWCKPS
jgi:hypothetical protein